MQVADLTVNLGPPNPNREKSKTRSHRTRTQFPNCVVTTVNPSAPTESVSHWPWIILFSVWYTKVWKAVKPYLWLSLCPQRTYMKILSKESKLIFRYYNSFICFSRDSKEDSVFITLLIWLFPLSQPLICSVACNALRVCVAFSLFSCRLCQRT